MKKQILKEKWTKQERTKERRNEPKSEKGIKLKWEAHIFYTGREVEQH